MSETQTSLTLIVGDRSCTTNTSPSARPYTGHEPRQRHATMEYQATRFEGSLLLTLQTPSEDLVLILPRPEEGHHSISLPDPADTDEIQRGDEQVRGELRQVGEGHGGLSEN
jgi:hypothetical protein